jgi:hypothetical protein
MTQNSSPHFPALIHIDRMTLFKMQIIKQLHDQISMFCLWKTIVRGKTSVPTMGACKKQIVKVVAVLTTPDVRY